MKLNFHYKNTNPIFTIKQKEETPVLQFSIFEQTGIVNHGFSTRIGGVSTGIFESMNLGFSRGDNLERVRENYRRITNTVGVSPERIVCSDQTHTTNVRIVNEEDAGKGFLIPKDYQNVDGLITNVPGLCLVTYYADCVPLLFVDPVQKVIASSHSGWRGTVGQIGRTTIQKMQTEFGCRPEHIMAAIGPSICQECYEVRRCHSTISTGLSRRCLVRFILQKRKWKIPVKSLECKSMDFVKRRNFARTSCSNKSLYLLQFRFTVFP